MPWMSDTNSEPTQDNVFLQYPQKLSSVGDKTEVKIRVLAGDPTDPSVPAGVWVHWVDQKPYNCARPAADCPLCEVRSLALKVDADAARKQYPMRSKSFFNVLVYEGESPTVKVFSFGHAVSKDLKEFAERYGDLRTYDVTVRKTQIGKLAMNIEYSVFFEGKRELSAEEQRVAQNLHDLSPYVQPGDPKVLAMLAKGETPSATQDESEEVRAHNLIQQITGLLPEKIDLKHFGIDVDHPQISKLEALLNSLKGA